MNTIRNYINAMFSTLPKTPEMLRLQAEMLENMEDKFNDLLREGKSENEAIGIILGDIGSADDLREELGITEDTPVLSQEDHSAFLAERAAFQQKFAVAITAGVALCICAIIAAAVCDAFTRNDAATAIAFFGPIAVAVAIFVYFGIRSDWYDQQYKAISNFVEDEKDDKSFSALVSKIIFPLAVIFYLLIGFMWGLWHPGWVIFPLCGVIVGVIEAFEKYKE
ncbi:MAG: permease prefix domain 1-containing protein [Eubacteriales bacterium]|nr:permease prefix domain 1-containing protein [Eubacteriales bacterium]